MYLSHMEIIARRGQELQFSLAERHTLLRDEKPVQSFPPQLTELQRQTLDLLGVPEHAFLAG